MVLTAQPTQAAGAFIASIPVSKMHQGAEGAGVTSLEEHRPPAHTAHPIPGLPEPAIRNRTLFSFERNWGESNCLLQFSKFRFENGMQELVSSDSRALTFSSKTIYLYFIKSVL